jgi:putative PIN family toxin of toxin-antitoxin system
MKVVIDTNIFVACYSVNSLHHDIFRNLILGKYKLMLTNSILFEYEEVLGQKYPGSLVEIFKDILSISENVILVEPYILWNLIEVDPDDNKFVDCAVNSGADFIVTQDKHFNILKTIGFPPTNVIGIDAFLEIVKNM